MKWTGCLSVCLAAALTACAALPGVEPEVRGVDARVAALDLDGLDVVFDVQVYNPLLSALHAPHFRYALDVQGRTLASGRKPAGADFPGAGVGTVSIPVRLAYRDLAAVYGDLSSRSEAEYELSGEFKVPLFGTTVDLPFSHAGTVPIVRPPSLELESVDTSGLSLGGGEIHVDVAITNPNDFAVGVENLGYGLVIGGRDVGNLSGSTGGEVGAGARRTLRLTGRLSASDAISGLLGGGGEAAGVRPTGRVTTPYGTLKMQ